MVFTVFILSCYPAAPGIEVLKNEYQPGTQPQDRSQLPIQEWDSDEEDENDSGKYSFYILRQKTSLLKRFSSLLITGIYVSGQKAIYFPYYHEREAWKWEISWITVPGLLLV